MNKAKPIKVIIEFCDETVDMCEFVKRVLEDEDPKEECENNIKDVRIK